MTAILIILLLSLASVFFFDFTNRAVYWWIYAIVIICSGIYSFHVYPLKELAISIGINSLIITIQLVFVQLWFYIKNKKFIWIFNTAIGVGDILFFTSPIILFPTLGFLSFILIGLFISLTLHVFAKRFIKTYGNTIPLAGYLSLTLMFFLIVFDITTVSIVSYV